MAAIPPNWINETTPAFLEESNGVVSISGKVVQETDGTAYAPIQFDKITDGSDFVNLGIREVQVFGAIAQEKDISVTNTLDKWDNLAVGSINVCGDGVDAGAEQAAKVNASEDGSLVLAPCRGEGGFSIAAAAEAVNAIQVSRAGAYLCTVMLNAGSDCASFLLTVNANAAGDVLTKSANDAALPTLVAGTLSITGDGTAQITVVLTPAEGQTPDVKASSLCLSVPPVPVAVEAPKPPVEEVVA